MSSVAFYELYSLLRRRFRGARISVCGEGRNTSSPKDAYDEPRLWVVRKKFKLFKKLLTHTKAHDNLEHNKEWKDFGEWRRQTKDSDEKPRDENGWLSSKLICKRTNDYGTEKETKEHGSYS